MSRKQDLNPLIVPTPAEFTGMFYDPNSPIVSSLLESARRIHQNGEHLPLGKLALPPRKLTLLERVMGFVSPPRLPDFSHDEVFRFLQKEKARQERLHIPHFGDGAKLKIEVSDQEVREIIRKVFEGS